MITTEQKTELEDILDVLGENLSITEAQHDAAVRSYKAVGNWLTNDESKLSPYNPVKHSEHRARLFLHLVWTYRNSYLLFLLRHPHSLRYY